MVRVSTLECFLVCCQLSVTDMAGMSTVDYRHAIGACPNEEFTCDNGKCVPRQCHCNGSDECGDGTDELHCSFSELLTLSTVPHENRQCLAHVCVSPRKHTHVSVLRPFFPRGT